ncbi:hypothetical protein EGH10_17440 [Brevibacillus laterosporus]|uniref:DUF4083 domain-containing protein n=1 Tax=Brevibacillus laterosporus LMG 15441 TaxID=1042163 RepID=A0A075R3P2_BRELA|nr:hypothetical protein BRLA_c017830 [Brevibacillus laterosporus LMG 15441]RJL06123.1 hypothetical protein DM460_22280 [Brevibacillus laterosporus]TPH07245.1 hypothetical protein EGH10_17440 [Brevibacillus laterosporus]
MLNFYGNSYLDLLILIIFYGFIIVFVIKTLIFQKKQEKFNEKLSKQLQELQDSYNDLIERNK